MSSSLYETRPALTESANPAPAAEVSVASRVLHLDPGWFALSLMPGPIDRGPGLPGVRVSSPPGPSGRRETVAISAVRGDGWMTMNDEPTVLRVVAGGGEILVTQYWLASESGTPPALRLVRLNPEAAVAPAAAGTPQGPVAAPRSAQAAAEVVAHIEGVGDVDGQFGDFVGMRGSGRAVEGFSLAPRSGITAEDLELRAVLGRDWLSPWMPGTSFCGSRGLALPLRGFCVRLRPAAAARFELISLARFVDGSEIGPVGVDQVCAAPSLAALEAFRVLLRPRVA